MENDIEKLRQTVIERIDLDKEVEEEELREIVDDVIKSKTNYRYMDLEKRAKLHKEIYASIKGLGVIEQLIADEQITEIMINGPHNIFVEKKGAIFKIEGSYGSNERLMDVIQQIVGSTNRRVNEANPIVDTRLLDGSRVNIVLPPVSKNGAVVTIRKFPKESMTMDDLIEWKSITIEVASFLEKLVIAGYNIFVSGGTGSGKTTFLNILSNYIPKDERIITIEDSAELQLKNVENLVTLEVKQPNAEGNNEVSIRDLIKTSLRMRPDRIIVGEVRGGESLDMLQAMNTGHDGSMSTGHSNSPKDMLSRLETMVLMNAAMPLAAIRSQIASAIDIIIHLGRLRDRTRKVLEIDEILGMKDGEIIINPLYRFVESGEENGKVVGELTKTKNSLQFMDKLQRKGISIYQ